jgi:hypothetical protein
MTQSGHRQCVFRDVKPSVCLKPLAPAMTLISLLILPRTLSAQPDNKHDEAQHPPGGPGKLGCGAHLLRRQAAHGIRKHGLILVGSSAMLSANRNCFVDNNQILQSGASNKIGAGSLPHSENPAPILCPHPPNRDARQGRGRHFPNKIWLSIDANSLRSRILLVVAELVGPITISRFRRH